MISRLIIILKKQNMKKNIFLTFFLLSGFLLGLTSAAVTITAGSTVNNLECPPPSTTDQNKEPQSQGSSTKVAYTATSSFYDTTNSRYSEIMVRAGSGSNPFKFVFYDSNSIKHEVACAGTSDYTFLKLINNFLFLRDQNYPYVFYACRFDPATAMNSVNGFTPKTITLPAGTGWIMPYSVRETTTNSEWKIYTAITDGSSITVASFLWSTINTASVSLTSTITNSLTIMDGVEDVIYNDVDGFDILSAGAYVSDARLTTPASGSTVVFYRTLTQTSFIGVYASGSLSASFYKISYTSQLNIASFTDIATTSTTAYVDYFDDSANIMIISTDQIAWLNVATDDTLKKVIATTAQIPTLNLQAVQFVGTNAVFTYTDKLVTYEITADNTVTKTLSRSTASPVVLSSSDYQSILALSCFCRVLRTAVCYSSTLNCLMISKATQNCPA